MFDPFKRMRAKARRKLQRSTMSAMADAWGAVNAPAKPAKRKPAKTAKPAATSPKETSRRERGPRRSLSYKTSLPATARSNSTVPRGASFETAAHDCAFGARSYELYIPSVAKTAADPVPLIVMLHGCGQTPQDFARGTGMNALAEEFGFLVLYPAQAREAQRNRCWTWFNREDQARGAGEPALIASLTHRIICEQNVDPARVYVAGLSAGAAAALIAATCYPDIFAAVGVHSGLAVGAAHDAPSAARAMQRGDPGQRRDVQMPAIIFHGSADKVVNPRNGRFVAMRALEPYERLDRTEKTGSVPGGRDYTRITHRVGKGRSYSEHWVIHGSGHAWSGGNTAGSYTDAAGPDASREFVRFFLRHRTTRKRRSAPFA